MKLSIKRISSKTTTLHKLIITHVDVSSFTREKFAGQKIPTLEDAVEECIKLQLTIYFDVKGHPDEVQPTELTNKTA